MIYKTCGGKDLVDIECRMSRTLHKYSESMQNNLLCNTDQGFRCLHEDQIGQCHDYEVRLLCMYPWCYPRKLYSFEFLLSFYNKLFMQLHFLVNFSMQFNEQNLNLKHSTCLKKEKKMCPELKINLFNFSLIHL